MMGIPQDIVTLLASAEAQMREVRAAHAEALKGKQMPGAVAVIAKNMLENLRSALDYLAGEIRRRCCPGASKKTKYYFPLVQKRKQFEDRSEEWFPGLRARFPEIWDLLERTQPYPQRGPELRSLRDLPKLANLKKHHRLIPQVRHEAEIGVPSTTRLGAIVYRHKEFDSQAARTVDKWVDFVFEGTGISAVALPEFAWHEVQNIVEEVCSLLPEEVAV